ncbi:hypothetical protein BSKO_06678 [Bryopsis sp. KO-2023]|nr:hypothetical protein BSKO_06678 [Bryopsis sp. KO-2023]
MSTPKDGYTAQEPGGGPLQQRYQAPGFAPSKVHPNRSSSERGVQLIRQRINPVSPSEIQCNRCPSSRKNSERLFVSRREARGEVAEARFQILNIFGASPGVNFNRTRRGRAPLERPRRKASKTGGGVPPSVNKSRMLACKESTVSP